MKLLKTLLAVVAVTACVMPLQAKNQWTMEGKTYDVDTIVYPHKVGPGVTYSRYDLPSFPLKVSVLEIDLNNPYIDLESYLSGEKAASVEDPLSIYNRYRAAGREVVGAVNGDFFRTSPSSEWGIPTSGMLRNGQLLINPAGRAGFTLDDQRHPYIDRVNYKGTITFNGVEHDLHSVNCIRVGNESTPTTGIFLFNEFWGKSYYGWTYGRMVLVSPKDGTFKWAPNGSETVVIDSIFNSSPINIPEGKALLWFRGDPAQLTKDMHVGDEIEIGFKVWLSGMPDLDVNFMQNVGGSNHIILRNGQLAENWEGRQPRTCMGMSADSTKIYFAVLDGRSTTSLGVSLFEAAGAMLGLGAWNAVNLDGGGSSCMVVNGDVANRLSDGMLRDTGNGWAIISNAPADDQIGIIDFAPRSFNLSCSAQLSFGIYGYNQYGVLLDRDLQGCTFSCDEQLGSFTDNGVFVAAATPATGKIYADYNGITCETDVTLIESEKHLRSDSVVIDRNHPYRIGVVAVSGLGEDDVDPMSMQWTIKDPTVCRLHEGTLIAVADGRTEVYGVGEGFADTLVVRVENPKAHITTIQGDEVIPENWNFVASGGKDATITALDNGLKVTFTGTSSRSAYFRLTLNPPLQLWGIPDTIRVRFRPNNLQVSKVYIYTAANKGPVISNTMPIPEESVDGEYTINLPTADWVDAANMGVYPLKFSYVGFSMKTTVGTQYEVDIPGLELIYNDGYPEMVPGDVDGNFMVNGDDINALINIILCKNTPSDFYGEADVNGDGTIDGADLNTLINIYFSLDY